MALQVVKHFLGRTAVAKGADYVKPVEGLPEVVDLATAGSYASAEVMRDVVAFQADGFCPPAHVTHEVRERIPRKICATLQPGFKLASLVLRELPVECFKGRRAIQ